LGSSESEKDLELADSRPRETADFRSSPAPTRSRELLFVLILLVVAWGVQWFVVATRRIPASSDQAIVGLMAKHILERGDHPVFYYGSAYAGSLEPHYVAGVFALLGPSPASYRIAMGGLVLLMMLGTWALTREAFGPRPAIFALAYLALPPFYFLYKGLTSDGHYDAFNLFVVGVLLVCIRIEKVLATGGDLRRLLVALGVLFGIGWWINPITPPISAAAAAWIFFRKRHPPLRKVVWVVAGFLAGSIPWTWWNLRHQWASLVMPELGHVGIRGALHNLSEVFARSLPILTGGMRFRIEDTADTFPFSSVVVGAILIAVLIPSVRRAVTGDRVLRLLFLCFLLLTAAAIWSTRYLPGEPRLLFPYYVLIPPAVAVGLDRMSRGPAGRFAAAACGSLLLVAHASSIAVEYRHLQNTDEDSTGSLDTLRQALSKEGVRHLYTDYWTAYRLAFESNEQIIAAPIPGDEAVRYVPYQREVAEDPSAAIVIRGSRDLCLTEYLRERALPFRRTFVPPFAVFTRLPPEVNRFVGEKGALPLPDDAYRVTWKIGAHPIAIPRAGTSQAAVTFRNMSPCSWPHAVHLGYHWSPMSAGLPAIWDGGRELPNRRIEPGQMVTLPVHLKAPEVPGRYSLVYDLVFEQVDFFSTRGGATVAVPMDIR
jgi:hypothetical protein